MKTLQQLLLGIVLFTCSFTQAQVQVNVNIGTPPPWGPAGYTEARYYYIPDIETYYDVSTKQYIYINNGNWVRAATLPVVYRNYNLYNGYKVVVSDYRGTTPYVYYKTHKVKYPKGYKAAKKQKTIGLPPGQAKKVVAARSVSNKHSGHGHNHKGHGKGKGKKD